MPAAAVPASLKASLDAFERGAGSTRLAPGVRRSLERRFRAKYASMPDAEWRLLRAKVLDTARRSGKIAAHIAAFENAKRVRLAVAKAALRLAQTYCPAGRPGRVMVLGKVCQGVPLA